MKTMPDFVAAYGSRPMGALRLLGFVGLVIALSPVQMIYKFVRPGDPFRIPQFFHHLLMRVLGFNVRVHGAVAAPAPVLFVANHVSYLDIPVLSALIPAAFVAKSEVASWPVIGLLCKLQNTLFIERRSSQSNIQKNYLRVQLAKKQSLVIFPEGTSTDGLTVLPFKSSLFSIVEEGLSGIGLRVQPVSISCSELDGLPITRARRPLYAWYGDMTLVKHLWDVFKLGCFTMDVIFHPPVTPEDFPDRKALARYCHQQVARGIEKCLKGRDFAPGPKKKMERLLPAI